MNQRYVWIVGGFILVVSLLIGGVIGGVVGYTIASGGATEASLAQPAGVLQIEPVAANATSSNQPSTIVVDRSDSVEAVQTVLPAVVTVINQGVRGGGSGSGVFFSGQGYLVT